MSLWTFDEAWHAVTDERGALPHAETYQQVLINVITTTTSTFTTYLVCIETVELMHQTSTVSYMFNLNKFEK